MARCLIVQHVEPEAPYAIADALEACRVVVDVRQVFAGEPLPTDASSIDGLVVMGGPMSATDDEGFPSRSAEIALLADARNRGVPTLGVCLGAQLLAQATGGSVSVGHAGPEIGWGEVTLSPDASTDQLLAGLPGQFHPLHWHGDTFALPPGATHLASSDRYPNQAFRIGEYGWGFQFHFEVDARAVETFLAAFGDEATAAGNSAEIIGSATAIRIVDLAPVGQLVAARFAQLVARFAGRARLPQPG